ncbi:MAG: hypothetical protein A2X97_00205 [Bdellovibrionales bacterium GWA1_52_35]|nr:MAG: hypothetical protein A2X97_00205 [Bdellovibrionales bacterium GWA1_52_35]HCM41237.1 long-chain fatty acid--CoA ligase [Bdellovibrionales bacterium]
MTTILHRLAHWAEETPDALAQSYKIQGAWKSFTAKEYCDRVYYMALFLESKGFKPGDISCIFASNSYQWVHLDLAVILLGGRSAGIYPNSIPKDILYILNHTGAKILAVQNQDYYAKALSAEGALPVIEKIQFLMTFDQNGAFAPHVLTYDAAIEQGRKLAAQPGVKSLETYLTSLDPDAGAFIVYTSGTTGNPKGALISQDNLAFTSDQVDRAWRLPTGADQKLFSFLPLCHIAEKLHSIGVGISKRYHVSFCTKFDSITVELPEVQPTLMLCVPRLWEKMMEGVNHKLRKAPPSKKRLALWALEVGKRVAEARFAGKFVNPVDRIQFELADRLVLSKIRRAMGLGQATLLASGAAALPAHVSRWYRRLGFEILDCLGQTETTGMICLTEPGIDSAGAVGKPLPGTEMMIAEDGEVLTRGRQIFKGYYKDDAATAQVLEGGWLHSGDLGEVNEKGLLVVRGRKKEVMKTSGGKMIAPLPIEELIKASPLISQVCIVGDGRKYPSALITLSELALGELREKVSSREQRVIKDPTITATVKAQIAAINKSLAGYEQIKRFTILANEFSVEEGEMTPTQKMKRTVIEKHYQDIIDSMYSGAAEL